MFAPAGEPFSWIEADWVIPDVDAPRRTSGTTARTGSGSTGTARRTWFPVSDVPVGAVKLSEVVAPVVWWALCRSVGGM